MNINEAFDMAIEALEVIRCKDCQYLRETEESEYFCANKTNGLVSLTDFCSFARKRDEECDGCRYYYFSSSDEPCCVCGDNHSKYEGEVE